jgi:hypothetical protein
VQADSVIEVILQGSARHYLGFWGVEFVCLDPSIETPDFARFVNPSVAVSGEGVQYLKLLGESRDMRFEVVSSLLSGVFGLGQLGFSCVGHVIHMIGSQVVGMEH